MKEALNKKRPIIIMECDNCLCKFKTDEYAKYTNGVFRYILCYRDTCPECGKKIYIFERF